MRSKRLAVRSSVITQEENPSIGYSETTNSKEISNSHVNDTLPVEAMIFGHDTPLNSNGLSPMKVNSGSTNAVRRSGRLKSSRLVAEYVNLLENDKEGGPRSQPVSAVPVLGEQHLEQRQQVQQDNSMPDENKSNVEEKIDYLVRAVDEFKTQGFGQAPSSPNDDHSPDFSYKTLYLDAQKKIDALVAENYELVKKLEYARGKVAAYERMKEVAKASNEVLFVRATEAAAVSVSPQVVHIASPSTVGVDPKKKGNSNSPSNSKKRKGKA